MLFIFTVYKNERKEYKFRRQKILKSSFYKNKKINNIEDINVNKILVSGYNDNDFIRLLCIRLPQMTGYIRKFDENATMSFGVNNKQLLKNYNRVSEKAEKLMRIYFESKLFMVMMINT